MKHRSSAGDHPSSAVYLDAFLCFLILSPEILSSLSIPKNEHQSKHQIIYQQSVKMVKAGTFDPLIQSGYPAFDDLSRTMLRPNVSRFAHNGGTADSWIEHIK